MKILGRCVAIKTVKQSKMIESKSMLMKLISECSQEMKFELNPEWWEDVTSADTWGKKVTGERDSSAQRSWE